MISRRLFVVFLAAVATLTGSRTEYLNAKRKFQSLEKQNLRPGSRVAIPANELNAYVQAEFPQVAPAGVRQPVVDLVGGNTATGKVTVDFLRLRSAQGKATNWLLRQLLQGEHELAVTTRIRSGGGMATIDLQKVEIAGVPIQGGALDFLIRNYLLPNYPQVKIGRPFALPARVDRIEVTPGVAHVLTR